MKEVKYSVFPNSTDHYTFGVQHSDHIFRQVADYLIAQGVTIPEWIPVSEGLPNKHAEAYYAEWGEDPEYLVMIDRGRLPTTLYYDRENEMWYKINSALKREVYQVTHWMHLPEPVKRD